MKPETEFGPAESSFVLDSLDVRLNQGLNNSVTTLTGFGRQQGKRSHHE